MKRPVPRSCRTEPKTPWGVPAAKVARASRERTRCGCTQFVWVADIGWTHRASFTPGGRKTCWGRRALARKKSVAPPDAGRGWAEGETVRVCAGPLKVSVCMACGFRLAGSRYDERRSRANARLALTGGAKQRSSGSQVQLHVMTTGNRSPDVRTAHRADNGFRLGRACR